MIEKKQNNNWSKIIIAILLIATISILINIIEVVPIDNTNIEGETDSEYIETISPTSRPRGTRSIINVPSDYPTIQEAINASFDGDTIIVASGTYYENIFINKSISLIGESKENTTISGSGIDYKDVVYIIVDSVYLTRFNITNAGYSSHGIELSEVSNVEIYNCILTDNEWGIRLFNSDSNIITNNYVLNSRSGGIQLHESNLNTLNNNHISNNYGCGIGLDLSSLNFITNNSILNHSYGIGLYSRSKLNSIENNSISNNYNGIDMHSSSLDNEVHYNNISNNRGHGIFASSDSPINASYNWWGDASGPYHLTSNPDGKGDDVTDYVVFKPWLLTPEANYTTDIDSDGMPDWWEIEYDLNPFNGSDANLDIDRDYLTNLQEFLNGTKPNNNETDGDSLGDGFEVIFSKTKPNNWDTNGNGIGDGLEFIQSKGYLGWIESLPDDWIGMTITWDNYTILVKTNSSVLEGEFDKEEQKLKIKVSGPNGTQGVTEIEVPKSLCEPEDIEIKLDGELINYTITEDETYYYIHIEYNHSVHELSMEFGKITEVPSEEAEDEKGFLADFYQIALIIAVITILALLILIIKIRSEKENIGLSDVPPERLKILLEKKYAEGKMTEETYEDIKSLLEKYRSS